jgi:hypothetical protein
MSVKRFKFVSPGVFVNEIDNSQLPAERDRLGPVVIGRTERGPAMRPVTVSSQAEFIEMFGSPVPGGKSGDVWRGGNYQSPMYASYAAMAYLRNNGPVTVVRLAGHEHENKDAAGKAGWKVDHSAYGLFLYDSRSGDITQANQAVTGTLAAIFYCDEGVVSLSGTSHHDGLAGQATAEAFRNVGDKREFKAIVYDDSAATNAVLTTTFNFDRNSDKYIRKVFNTNPSLTAEDGSINSENLHTYWLGQTFEDSLSDTLASSSVDDVAGIMLQLTNDTNHVGLNQRAASSGNTGWVLSQQLDSDSGSFDPKANTPVGCSKLFKIHSLDSGEWESANLKVSIEGIRYSRNETENPFGSFTVAVRSASDNDAAPKFLERYTNCNLNPMSANYIKRKIGDQTLEWDEGERRYKYVGDYSNASQYIRVEVNPELDNAALDPLLIPFGFQGPSKLKTIQVPNNILDGAFAQGNLETANSVSVMSSFTGIKNAGGGYLFGHADIKLEFPSIRLRTSTASGSLPNRKAAYWGISTLESGSNNQHNAGWSDLVFPLPDGIGEETADVTERMWAFSIDDVALSNGVATWAEGKRADGTSVTAVNASWQKALDEEIDKFTMPLFGGFDGLDVRTLDPFAPDLQMSSDSTEKSSYEYYSVKKAIDMCADSEVVECNLMAMPGITTNGLNQHLVNVCESRADALAVLDLEKGYLPRANRHATSQNTFATYGGSVIDTLDNLKTLGINSSYACCYYPWVQIRDSESDGVLWVPPSVVALGTMGSSETKSEVWFAPAGFTRGGLTEGSAGVPVIGVRDRLTSKQRDDLYAESVNPIATFPAEGVVIFGQKTMQVTRSALDRINVRRLMIFVKKEISRMAATTLFDQNVKSTWNRFLGRVNPFLRSVQARLGLVDFKVILDETTTTPELIDRNIMYAKILLKPARAIEFIAIDFVITDSGASFED